MSWLLGYLLVNALLCQRAKVPWGLEALYGLFIALPCMLGWLIWFLWKGKRT